MPGTLLFGLIEAKSALAEAVRLAGCNCGGLLVLNSPRTRRNWSFESAWVLRKEPGEKAISGQNGLAEGKELLGLSKGMDGGASGGMRRAPVERRFGRWRRRDGVESESGEEVLSSSVVRSASESVADEDVSVEAERGIGVCEEDMEWSGGSVSSSASEPSWRLWGGRDGLDWVGRNRDGERAGGSMNCSSTIWMGMPRKWSIDGKVVGNKGWWLRRMVSLVEVVW